MILVSHRNRALTHLAFLLLGRHSPTQHLWKIGRREYNRTEVCSSQGHQTGLASRGAGEGRSRSSFSFLSYRTHFFSWVPGPAVGVLNRNGSPV